VITIGDDKIVVRDSAGRTVELGLGTKEAFELLSRLWLRSGWDLKYVYSFTWLGRPVIQLPEDLLRIQEVVYSIQPDVIVETGVAHGGSLVFYATICKALGKGRVIGVDCEIRPPNRRAIAAHPLHDLITLVEGDSVSPAIVAEVRAQVRPGDTVLVLLDSCHTKDHVLKELEAYAPLVSVGSYIVAMDGIMENVAGAPRTQPDWTWNNPRRAALEFAAHHPGFEITEPEWLFNEGAVAERVTYWLQGFLKRVC
jgi:cephalosporin hydroxylase